MRQRKFSIKRRSGVFRSAAVATGVASLALLLAACGSSTSSSAVSSTAAAKPAAASSSSTASSGVTGLSSSMSWCGPKKATLALADGNGDNTWREITRYSAVVTAAKCKSVTGFTYSNGQDNLQESISNIGSLVSQGTTAMVVFPDFGKAELPALTRAYHAGAIVVPYRVSPGGKAGVNYNAFISTNFAQAGVLWAKDVAKAIGGKGQVAFLSGPPANSQGLEEYQGIESVFKNYPGIQLVGQKPYNVTNWLPSDTDQVVSSLLASYPHISAFISDFGTALAGAFPQFQKAGVKIPVIATEDANSLGCDYYSLKKTNPNFELFTVSSQTWMVEYAIRYAVALATKGKVPSSTVVPQESYENSVTGKPHMPVCIKSLPPTAIDSSGLTNAQQIAALKGVVPTLSSLR